MKTENLGYLLAIIPNDIHDHKINILHDNRFISNNGIILNATAKPTTIASNGTDEMYKYSISSRVTKVTILKRLPSTTSVDGGRANDHQLLMVKY